jgi:hypothetical protein
MKKRYEFVSKEINKDTQREEILIHGEGDKYDIILVKTEEGFDV